MKNLKFSLFALALIFSLSSFVNIQSKVVKLGSKKVNYGLDKDVIHVGLKKGTFKKIQLKVTGGNLNMHKVIVEYRNGDKDKINVKHNFNSGSTSRVLDLEGSNRLIKDITFWYDTKNNSRKKATVTVLGIR